MYNKIITCVFVSFLCSVFTTNAQDILFSGIPSGPFCGGDTFTVSYNYQHTQALGSSNRFSIVLSNINGSFSSGTVSIAITATTQNPIGSLLATIPYNLTKSSKYRIKVITSSPAKESAISDSVTINDNPVANFTINASNQCFKNHNYIFTNTSSGTGQLNYLWQFSDGDSSNAQNSSKKFSVYGNYTVTLTTSGTNYSCKNTKQVNLTLRYSPTADFTINKTSLCRNDTAFFTNTSTTPTGGMTYDWNFGASGGSSISASPFYKYTIANNYQVKLIVSNTGNSCRDTMVKAINVNELPVADFGVAYANRCYRTNRSTLVNSSSITSGTLTYLWEFGDGDTSTQKSPEKIFKNTSNTNVTLTATSQAGCKSVAKSPVVLYSEPKASFTINDSTQCQNENSFSFTNTSKLFSGGTATYNWLIGTTTSTTSTPPTFPSSAAGFFTARLIVTATNGNCKDTVYHSITVYPTPVKPTILGLTACIGQQTANYNVNGSSINTYNWGVTGGTIQSGQGSQQISVKWLENNGITGRVSVIEVSPYGCTSPAFMLPVSLSSSGVEETKNQFAISVYPNPSSGEVSINAGNYTGEYSISVYNQLGQLVFAEGEVIGEKSINLKELNEGIYFIKLKGEGFDFSEKIIKNGN